LSQLLSMTASCLRLTASQLRLTANKSQSQSQSYVTTDGQSASLSWNKAPIWGLRPDFHYSQTIAVFFYMGRPLWLQKNVIVLYNPSARTTQKTHQLPRDGYPQLLPGVSTDVLPSNGHTIVVTRLSGNVFTGSLYSTGHPIVAYSLPRDVYRSVTQQWMPFHCWSHVV
jgi:hypothetical protein